MRPQHGFKHHYFPPSFPLYVFKYFSCSLESEVEVEKRSPTGAFVTYGSPFVVQQDTMRPTIPP